MIDSGILKGYAVIWLKYRKKCFHIATEAGRWSADVLGSNESDLVEIEVKISKSDLKNDLNKRKHDVYASRPSNQTPTNFYFLIPIALQEFALNFLAEHKLPYGLITVDPKYRSSGYDIYMLDDMRVVKKAKRLHKHSTHPHVLREIQSRQLNEFIHHYIYPKTNGAKMTYPREYSPAELALQQNKI